MRDPLLWMKGVLLSDTLCTSRCSKRPLVDDNPIKVWLLLRNNGLKGMRRRERLLDGAGKERWRVESRGVERAAVSQPGGWMDSLPPCLLYSLFACCLALAFTLALAHMRVRVQRETFRTAGIYYKPNKRIRHLVYELLAFQRQQRPLFS